MSHSTTNTSTRRGAYERQFVSGEKILELHLIFSKYEITGSSSIFVEGEINIAQKMPRKKKYFFAANSNVQKHSVDGRKRGNVCSMAWNGHFAITKATFSRKSFLFSSVLLTSVLTFA